MPIKLKKTDILNNIDAPKEGYMILGFNEQGKLSYKDSDGNYDTIVPTISTGNYERLVTNYFTIGYRLLNSDEGLYSLSQGGDNDVSGLYAAAQGYGLVSNNTSTTARGEYTAATGEYAYSSGKGASILNKMEAAGLCSFIHSFSNTTSLASADYSAILGGYNHNIGSSATNSIILGGHENTANNLDVAIIACQDINSTVSDAVYVPRLIISSSSGLESSTVAGTLEWSGTHFRGYNGSTWLDLDSNISSEISSVSTALSSEISTRTSYDTSLSTAISTETSTRSSSNISLSTAISNETSVRSSNVTSLSSAISTASSISLSTLSSVLGSNVTITSAGTWYTAASISLTSGTWIVLGNVEIGVASSEFLIASGRLRISSTVYASAETTTETTSGHYNETSLSVNSIITVGTTSTLYLEGTSSKSSSYIYSSTYQYTQIKSTYLYAIKIG